VVNWQCGSGAVTLLPIGEPGQHISAQTENEDERETRNPVGRRTAGP
jgi:hypothetical protein